MKHQMFIFFFPNILFLVSKQQQQKQSKELCYFT